VSLGAGDVWRVIKQRKTLISITFVLLYTLVVGSTAVIWKFAPAFPAEAYVQLIPPSTDPYMLGEERLPKDYVQAQLNTITNEMKSNETLLDLLKQEVIKNTQFYRWYGEGEKGQNDCLESLKDQLAITPVRDSYLIRVAISTRYKREAVDIVNTLAERFVERSRSMATDDRMSRVNQLIDTQSAVEEQLAEIRRRIADLRAQRDMPALESERTVLSDTISMFMNTKAELLARLKDIEAQLDTMRGSDPRNMPLSAEMKLMIETDPELRAYRQQVEAIDVEMEVLLDGVLGRDHRQMQLFRQRRDLLAAKEAARRELLIDDFRARQREALDQERARIRNTLASVQEQLAEHENEQRDLDAAITRLESLLRDEERISHQLGEVGLKVREAQHQHAVEAREGRLSVASRAKEAVWPSRPQPLIYLGGGFVLAAIVAVGIAFLREVTDQAVRTPVDVARFGHLSVLGSVPQLDDEEADIDAVEEATRQAPQSLVAEQFRQIRAHLMFSGPIESQRVLLITSPSPDDGKTSIAINLAVTLAQGNQRVLLVDCNFRRPGLHRAFAGTRPEGLSNVLVGHLRFDQAVTPTEVPSLHVLTSGPMPPNPAELLGSPQMRTLLETARQQYDRVILDGPPCLLMSDALVIAIQVDAVVMVARAGESSKGALRRARDQMQRINARVIGAILNGIQARPGGYYRKQYRDFYDYTSDEVVQAELPIPDIRSSDPAASDDDRNA
jgi:capsular exopolysaccharide synthesis family protein